MDVVELRLERLLQRLARENRQLLAMLRLGYSLRRAERILQSGKKQSTSRGAVEPRRNRVHPLHRERAG